MERVLYNAIASAKPILPDGSSFYYSDYNNADARKLYHRDKWPCCSGTFPQLTADYGISAYYLAADGIYVNLYLPSRASWTQGPTRCTVTQQTNYPAANTAQLEFAMARPERFTTHLRVPEWTDGKTRISVNGKLVEGSITPGKFFALPRTWKNGDRIEYEISMPLRLQAVDQHNPQFVALLRGPVALFGVGNLPAVVPRAQLLAAFPVSQSSESWIAQAQNGQITLRPFAAIDAEPYRLYHKVEG